MSQRKNPVQSDVSNGKASHPAFINEVGLHGVEVPIRIQWDGKEIQTQGSFSLLVSLDEKEVRGIHMSRLYLNLHQFIENNVVTPQGLVELLELCIQAQKGISKTGRVRVSFKASTKRKALKSSYEGWHTYPCFFEVQKTKTNKNTYQIQAHIGASVLYSSTCPCSAALSRELIQDQFNKEVQDLTKEQILEWLGKEKSHVATPHSQKSEATFTLTSDPKDKIDLLKVIQAVESGLGTPVQVAVKREDEQEFAYQNAQHLMYTEDAIRKIKYQLDSFSSVLDYHIQVRHIESLHPFDTLAQLRKSKK